MEGGGRKRYNGPFPLPPKAGFPRSLWTEVQVGKSGKVCVVWWGRFLCGAVGGPNPTFQKVLHRAGGGGGQRKEQKRNIMPDTDGNLFVGRGTFLLRNKNAHEFPNKIGIVVYFLDFSSLLRRRNSPTRIYEQSVINRSNCPFWMSRKRGGGN